MASKLIKRSLIAFGFVGSFIFGYTLSFMSSSTSLNSQIYVGSMELNAIRAELELGNHQKAIEHIDRSLESRKVILERVALLTNVKTQEEMEIITKR